VQFVHVRNFASSSEVLVLSQFCLLEYRVHSGIGLETWRLFKL
jgi:hypothetical protein